MLKYSKNKGITLIALVITIIVLLILAGVSISMLSGDNSILNKASESKNLSETNQEMELISIAYNSVLTNKMSTGDTSEITATELNVELSKYGASASGNNPIIVTVEKSQKKYTIDSQGNVGEYEYAKSRLAVKVNKDETIESPYYVNYPSANGTIKCRVLYNDSTYGLQLISAESVTTVALGLNDPNTNVEGEMGSLERAQNSYMRAITTLNEKAEEYRETIDGSILATDARCVGSNPLDKNYPDNLTGEARAAEMYIADSTYTYMEDYNGKYFKKDNLFKIDWVRLDKIGALIINNGALGSSYWLASRDAPSNSTSTLFRITCFRVLPNVPFYNFCNPLWTVNSDGTASANPQPVQSALGFRPVFKLSPSVKITGGEGTEETPFEIGL